MVCGAACERSVPLGMISGEIKDWQLSTSSTSRERTCHERHARLYEPNGRAWCANYKTSSEWIQIDLGVAAKARRSSWNATGPTPTPTLGMRLACMAHSMGP